MGKFIIHVIRKDDGDDVEPGLEIDLFSDQVCLGDLNDIPDLL